MGGRVVVVPMKQVRVLRLAQPLAMDRKVGPFRIVTMSPVVVRIGVLLR